MMSGTGDVVTRSYKKIVYLIVISNCVVRWRDQIMIPLLCRIDLSDDAYIHDANICISMRCLFGHDRSSYSNKHISNPKLFAKQCDRDAALLG